MPCLSPRLSWCLADSGQAQNSTRSGSSSLAPTPPELITPMALHPNQTRAIHTHLTRFPLSSVLSRIGAAARRWPAAGVGLMVTLDLLLSVPELVMEPSRETASFLVIVTAPYERWT